MLELTRELGNVAQACRRRGMDRTSFQEGKGRLQTHRFECSKDLPPIHKSPPQTSPPEAIEKIKALDRPACGCNRFEAILAPQGIRGVLDHHPEDPQRDGLGDAPGPLAGAEGETCRRGHHTPRRTDRVPREAAPPRLRERHVKLGASGRLRSADTFVLGTLKGAGTVCLHAVVDTYGSCALGSPRPSPTHPRVKRKRR